jgi:hypothetical protein
MRMRRHIADDVAWSRPPHTVTTANILLWNEADVLGLRSVQPYPVAGFPTWDSTCLYKGGGGVGVSYK